MLNVVLNVELVRIILQDGRGGEIFVVGVVGGDLLMLGECVARIESLLGCAFLHLGALNVFVVR